MGGRYALPHDTAMTKSFDDWARSTHRHARQKYQRQHGDNQGHTKKDERLLIKFQESHLNFFLTLDDECRIHNACERLLALQKRHKQHDHL